MLNLPRKNKDGKPYISYSQIKAWKSEKSFNLDIKGRIEYMIEYFHGHQFSDKGWSEFGNDVESYIVKRECSNKFNSSERAVLNKIVKLDLQAVSMEIDFGDFVLLMIIDDASKDFSKIRDYKTGSKSSLAQYKTPEYKQLDVYALGVYETYGFIPECEVLAIERKGNCMFNGSRKNLSVGDDFWIIQRKVSFEDIQAIKSEIIATAKEISSYYSTYLKLNKKS